jgi:hypothetical protein
VRDTESESTRAKLIDQVVQGIFRPDLAKDTVSGGP